LERTVIRAAPIALALAALTAAGHADPRSARTDRLIEAAAAAVAELRDDEALRLLEQAWERGTSGPDQLCTIFALAGRASGVTGDADAARTWFARWLSLDPAAALSAGTSPNLTELLEDVRARLAGARLVVRAMRSAGGVEVNVLADPAGLVSDLRATGVVGAVAVPVFVPATAHRLATPATAVDVLDRHGNVLVHVLVDVPVAGTAPGAGSNEPAWYARAPTWEIGAAVAAAVGSVALGVAAHAHSELTDAMRDPMAHQYGELLANQSTLSRAQWTSRIAFAAAAASAGVGVVFYLRGRRLRTAVIATPASTQVAWSVQF
jgi:hypothetical protein